MFYTPCLMSLFINQQLIEAKLLLVWAFVYAIFREFLAVFVINRNDVSIY